jgi:hypothetical protein
VILVSLVASSCLFAESVPGIPVESRLPMRPVSAGKNGNRLIERYKGKLKITASSVYNGWPVENLLDGKDGPAWFSASNDSAARGQSPWVEIEFPEAITLRRFTVNGCRDPNYPQGYFVLAGTLEVRDAAGRLVYQSTLTGAGKSHDFDFVLNRTIANAKSVRFTSIADQGDVNGSGDVALSELLAE